MDSANKHGSLLEVVQVLTDLNLTISRAYISSDGEWFMDGRISTSESWFFFFFSFFFFVLFLCGMVGVYFFLTPLFLAVFHVIDQDGNKIQDEEVFSRIQQVGLKTLSCFIYYESFIFRTLYVEFYNLHPHIYFSFTFRA